MNMPHKGDRRKTKQIEDIYIDKWQYVVYFKRPRNQQARLVTTVESKSTAQDIIDHLGFKYGVFAYYVCEKKVDTVEWKETK